MLSAPSAPSARELAGLLLRLCEQGLARRERGTCLGVGIVRPGMFKVRRAVRHAKSGHDAGCHAFGVSLQEAAHVLRGVDRIGASPLLLEALRDAAEELCGSSQAWEAAYARETLEIQMRRRITPA